MQKWLVVASGWALGSMLLAAPAFADIPPEDACMAADEGKACDNAGDNADQKGTCKKDSCTRGTPNGPMTYECYRCLVTDGGGTAGTAGTKPATDSKGSGCNVSAVGVGGWTSLAAPLLAFGLVAARRRRARR